MKLRILSKTGGCLAVKDRISLDVDTAWDTAPSEDTLIMFDESGYGKSAQVIQRTNHVFGAGNIQDGLELNTDFGRQIANQHGISTREAKGPMMSIDGFYVNGKSTGVMLSSIVEGGNAYCRIWKHEPKIHKFTLGKMAGFLSQFKYTGALSCECVIPGKTKMPVFNRWITHMQPHILWVVGPWIQVVMGMEKKNGSMSYSWHGIAKVSDAPCYIGCEHKSVTEIKHILRKTIQGISIYPKTFDDNLDAIEKNIHTLKEWRYL